MIETIARLVHQLINTVVLTTDHMINITIAMPRNVPNTELCKATARRLACSSKIASCLAKAGCSAVDMDDLVFTTNCSFESALNQQNNSGSTSKRVKNGLVRADKYCRITFTNCFLCNYYET